MEKTGILSENSIRKIDFDKVRTIEDIIRVLDAMDISVHGNNSKFEVISDLLIERE